MMCVSLADAHPYTPETVAVVRSWAIVRFDAGYPVRRIWRSTVLIMLMFSGRSGDQGQAIPRLLSPDSAIERERRASYS